MELISLYPFDPTGRSPDNKIQDESITVIPPAEIKDYSYVVPRAAPFYVDTMVVRNGLGPGSRRLIENVDYWCVIDFLSASHSLKRRVAVGIALLDANYSGTLYVTYQTVGGNYTLADFSVLEELIRNRYIVKHVSYEQIINLPEGFAPEWHAHQVADMVGMTDVVAKLTEMITAITENKGSFGQLTASFRDHLTADNVHTPSAVGLSRVKNYGVASVDEIHRGSTLKYVTADVLNHYVNQKLETVFNSTQDSIYAAQSFTKQSIATHGDLTLGVIWNIHYIPRLGQMSGSITITTPFMFNPTQPLDFKLLSVNDAGPFLLPLLDFNTSLKQRGSYKNYSVFLDSDSLYLNNSPCLKIGLQSTANTLIDVQRLTVHFTSSVTDTLNHGKLLKFLDGLAK